MTEHYIRHYFSRDTSMKRFTISVKCVYLRLAEIGKRSLCGKADMQTSRQRLQIKLSGNSLHTPVNTLSDSFGNP